MSTEDSAGELVNTTGGKEDIPSTSKCEVKIERKRIAPSDNSEEQIAKKKKKKNCGQEKWSFDSDDDVPMKVPFEIINGVRYLSPYWTVYRTRAKGRWFGKNLVQVFSQEFLSTNIHYAKVACRMGRIWVNGEQMTDTQYIVRSNDTIEHWGHRHEHPILDAPINIIADTPSLLVIDKPSSMPVHACGQYAIHTVLGQLRVRYGLNGLRVLHRLDRTTSGILIFAKDYETDREFKGTLKEGLWKKEYVCRVHGVFPEGEITVTEPIGTLVISMGIQCVRPDGKTAISRFRRYWTDGKESVVKVVIETGRTHQIRVHAQYLGFPIINDDLYNRPEIWPNNGKDAAYEIGLEELGERVRSAHKSSNWHEEINTEYEERMKRLATQQEIDMQPDPPDIMREDRPSYDLLCLSCNVKKKTVSPSHFRIFLHCLRYETEKWSYSTPLPSWAEKPSALEEKEEESK